MRNPAIFLLLTIAALVFPAVLGGADEATDGAPPRLLEWPMLPGESLRQLAQLIYPQDRSMQRRFIAAALRENPATFTRYSADTRFEQETLIWLPDLKQLSDLATTPNQPRHYLRPALPAMQPSAAGAQPSRLKMSAELEPQSGEPQQVRPSDDKLQLASADRIRHVNATPVYDAGALAEIEALTLRNQALKAEQEKLDARIAQLESAITALHEAIARDRRRPVRRVEQKRPAPPRPTGQTGDPLLPVSPFHLLSALAVILAGAGIVWARRRPRKVRPAVPVAPVTMPPPTARMEVEELTEASALVGRQPENPAQNQQAESNVITVDEIESVVEEAKVFVALGRAERAIEMLEEHLAAYPRASANPWLYLMDIYRSMNKRDEFTAVAKRFHQSLNVIAPQWDTTHQNMMVVPRSVTEFPHIMTRLSDTWGTLDAQDFLNHLLQDNRGGERQGFSMEVLEEILLLLAILELRDMLPEMKPF